VHNGDLATVDPADLSQVLDQAGRALVVVVSPDYRLAPEHCYPAGLDDAAAALSWLHTNPADLDVDPSRLAIGGTSAGAALAAGVALRARDEGGPALALLLLTSPVADSSLTGPSVRQFWDCAGWNGAATTLMWQHYLPADGSAAPYAAPARALSLRGLPPTEIVIADLDPLRDEGLALARRLDEADVSVTLHHYYRVPHGFDALLPHAETSARSIDSQVGRLARLAAQS
jgi:acetyl esterase